MLCKTIPGTVRSLVTLASTYQMPEMLPSHCDNQTLSPFPSHCNNQTLSPFPSHCDNQTLSPFPSHCDKHFHLFPVIATITFTFSQSLRQSNTFTFVVCVCLRWGVPLLLRTSAVNNRKLSKVFFSPQLFEKLE